MISNNVKGSRTLIKKKSIFLSEYILSERRSRNPKRFYKRLEVINIMFFLLWQIDIDFARLQH